MAFPLQETQVGATAYVHGISNDGTPFTLSGYASFVPESDDLTQTWNEKEKMDSTNNVQTIIATNAKYERTLRVSITGATRAAAVAASVFPAVLAKITVAHYAVAAYNGDWRLKPGTKMSLKFDDELTMEFPMEKYVDATQNAALVTTIVG